MKPYPSDKVLKTLEQIAAGDYYVRVVWFDAANINTLNPKLLEKHAVSQQEVIGWVYGVINDHLILINDSGFYPAMSIPIGTIGNVEILTKRMDHTRILLGRCKR